MVGKSYMKALLDGGYLDWDMFLGWGTVAYVEILHEVSMDFVLIVGIALFGDIVFI